MAMRLTNRDIKELDLLVETELYKSPEEALQSAIKILYQSLPEEKRITIGVYAFQRHEVSLNRAAELAGVPYERMRKLLLDQGLDLREGASAESLGMTENEFRDYRANNAHLLADRAKRNRSSA